MRLLAALSGGVDSAVAAARAAEAGNDVTAVHLALTHGADGSGCCTPDDARDAARVADVLGVPYYVWDLADTFSGAVIDDFVAAYANGQTPNPCVRCNERIKFSAVLERARALGFDGLVTGHHARLDHGVLRRSVRSPDPSSTVRAWSSVPMTVRTRSPSGSAEACRSVAARPSRATCSRSNRCRAPSSSVHARSSRSPR